jgi:hypothetical protein
MANMIIRPSSGTGNKVIVQDQAGAAVLTTADSGATVANAILASTTTFPAGHVLQVVNTTKTDTFSESLSANVNSSQNAIQVSITPSSTSNKILILWSINASGYVGSGGHISVRVVRGSTNVAVGDAAGNRNRITSISVNASNSDRPTFNSGNLLDSPSTTSAITYGIRLDNNDNGTATMYLNRSKNDTDSNVNIHRTASSITVMEIAG